MTFTEQNAKDSLVKMHAQYMPSNPYYIEYILGAFSALSGSVEERYLAMVETLFAVAHEGSVDPTFGGPVKHPTQYLADLTASEFVDFVYPNSPNRNELINEVSSGAISKVELGASSGLVTSPRPSVKDVVDAINTVSGGNGLPSVPSVELPKANLTFPGVTDEQVSFLVALYIGAFSRAPEFEGLEWWAGNLASKLETGVSPDHALYEMGIQLYDAGAVNGESGTGLSNSGYVEFAYNNSLGRQFDQGGFNYWVEKLDTGALTRGEFLSTFLKAALQNPADGEYLLSRIAVAEHAAQKHVSGPMVEGIDLHAVIEKVSNPSNALSAINKIIDDYGVLKSGTDALDTLSISGVKGQLTITDGIAIAETTSGKFVFDNDVERVIINGQKHVALDIDGNAGDAFRMYQAALNRTPDKDEVGYWINRLDKGDSLETVAGGFLSSPEFAQLYGSSPSNPDFINALYINVLGREADQSGFSYWMDKLEGGHITQMGALASFSVSEENKIGLVGLLENGIEFVPYA